MDVHNQCNKQTSGNHIGNIISEQRIFTNQISTYDPNLSSVARYSPPATYIPSDVNRSHDVSLHQANSVLTTTATEYASNCVTYSNVIFVPNTNTSAIEHSDSVEMIKDESIISSINSSISDPHSYKYIVSSDPRFLNTFIRNGSILENTAEMNINATVTTVNEYPEQAQSQHMTSASSANEQIPISNHSSHVNLYQQQNQHLPNNHHAGHHHQQHQPNLSSNHLMSNICDSFHNEKTDESEMEVILQGANGHLYRHVQNVYVNHNEINAVELMPSLVTEPMANEVGYSTEPYGSNHNVGQHLQLQHVGPSYEIQSNIGANQGISTAKAVNENQLITNISQNNHSVELVYGNYTDCGHIPPEHNQYTVLEPVNPSNVVHDQHANLMNHGSETGYQPSAPISVMDKDQQRILLESTMSPLLAAVNDITSRQEQFQTYMSANKPENIKSADNNMTPYQENCLPGGKRIDEKTQHSPHFCPSKVSTNHIHHDQSSLIPPTATVTSSKVYTSNASENSRMSCATPDEYVDINEMEFIQTKGEYGTEKDNMLMRRAHKKRAVRRNEELTVADKHVPCRALATLPTSYLYIGPSTEESSRDTVFAKKDIPLRTKFGPFEGDIKTLKQDEIDRYKENCQKTNAPLLFLDENQVLDTGNKFTSNWMRYVHLASNCKEQNLLLLELESKLYFKSCQFIRSKQQLKLGYDKEYAEKYNLPLPRLHEREKQKLSETQSPFLCNTCDQKFATAKELDEHSGIHNEQLQCNAGAVKTEEINLPVVRGKHRLNTGALRKRKLARSKLSSRASGPIVRYACCYCSKVFSKFVTYKKHTNVVHSVDVENKKFIVPESQANKDKSNGNDSTNREKSSKWFTCCICQRYFSTPERLEKHCLLHCKNESKSVQCQICSKRVLTPSALTMHLKTHNTKNGFFRCPFCSERYQNTLIFKEHVKVHMKNGSYFCPVCDKEFKEYSAVRKHIQLNHSSVRHKCLECGKDFKSKYKLREHKLRHSDVRQFLCADCGKQFKRKDKLKEHILKIHNCKPDSSKMIKKAAKSEDDSTENHTKASTSSVSEKSKTIRQKDESKSVKRSDSPSPSEQTVEQAADAKKFCPKVPPTDYQRFIYKCHDCLLGFKRRGMLVNHLAKRHPGMSITSVPELNLPILKTQRCYYCQYCEKVYKSSSKRKAHILKYHPGSDLPVSTRQKSGNMLDDSSMPNPTFSETIGSITTQAHQCPGCHKQYASRTRLLQHQRKSHGSDEQANDTKKEAFFSQHGFMVSEDHNIYNSFQQSPDQDSVDMDTCNMVNYSEIHENTHQYLNFEPENKLLKLSSAALEASIRDFFDHESEDKSLSTDQTALPIGVDSSSSTSRVHCLSNDFADTSSSNCDLNPLPQLFEGIDCINLKPTQYSSNENSNTGAQCTLLPDVESPLKKLMYCG